MTTIVNNYPSIEVIEKAFIDGNGHYFMHKDNFSDVVCVSEYDIKRMEFEGYKFFILESIRRPLKCDDIKKEVKANTKFKKTTQSPSVNEWAYLEMPDAFTCGGL